MRRRIFVVAAALAATTAASALGGVGVATAAPAAQCAPLIGISVRGYQETPENEKFAAPTLQKVRAQLGRPIGLYNLPYDSLNWGDGPQNEGVNNLTSFLNSTSQRCANTKFVLVGYSQGAVIVGNVLDNNNIKGSAILGAVFYGDPNFNGAESSFDRGTYNPAINGFYRPRATNALHPFEVRLHSYCRANDTVCQPTGPGGDGHVHYYEYLDNAANFLVSQIKAGT